MRLLESLDWDRFVDFATSEAKSEPAQAALRNLKDPEHWAQDLWAARQMQSESQEAVLVLDREALWGPLEGLADPGFVFERLRKNAVLELSELVLLRRWLQAMDSWIQVPREEIRGEHLRKAIGLITDPYQQLRLLDRVLTPEGEISENASPLLAHLHHEIRFLKKEITLVLDQCLKNYHQQGALQETFTDVRDGRYVLPVRISAQSTVDGIIYDASTSKQTVFIEPKEVAQLNNRLRQKQNELLQEVHRILKGLSEGLAPEVGSLESSVWPLVHWDCVQAKARWGRQFGGKTIHVTEERRFELSHTAHPLLWKSLPEEEIIRNRVSFGAPTQALLLTGPNTGGKTVLLKTLGLAGICARTGFPFPAVDHPTIPFFDSFFVDLGDSQSIETHLSSFSGHVVRFKELIEKSTGKSLVLLDELNSATDPEEGAALSRAVLETIMSRRAMIVTTTHDPYLKALAINDARILNASMEFDERSRLPTYRIVLGVPGRSRALETAERLGLPKEVIELAYSYLTQEHQDFEELLSRLEKDAHEMAIAKKEAVAQREEAERLRRDWIEKTESSHQEMMARVRSKLKRVLEQAQDEVRAAVRKLDELKSRRDIDETRTSLNQIASEASRKMEQALGEEAPDLAEVLEKNRPASEPLFSRNALPSLQVGDWVRIPKWKNTGTIVEIKKDKLRVAMGNMVISLGPSEIERIETRAGSPQLRPKKGGVSFQTGESLSVSSQLDLRGWRFEEAMSELEHYLDRALRAGLVEVTIVHGLGTGALREGSLKLLSRLPYVSTYREGPGGAGSTIVELSQR